MTNIDFNYTTHSVKRIQKRGFSKEDIQNCINYGKKFYRTGIKFFILRLKEIRDFGLNYKLNGLCVLVGPDNFVITVYKNPKAVNQTKKLPKFNMKKTGV